MALRKHCNPLAFRGKVEPLDFSEIFARPQPLEVDIGFGKGRFLIDSARARPQVNFLGLEVRTAFFERFSEQLAALDLPNLAAVHCNANWSAEELFEDGSVSRFHIYFPDPWFKKRHRKRRVLTRDFAGLLVCKLIGGGELLVKTDVHELALEMLDILSNTSGIENLASRGAFAAREWPVEQMSAWEHHLIANRISYDRMWFRKPLKRQRR